MKLSNILRVVLSALGVIGALVCVIMFIMAIRFGELGRVIVYFVLAVLCAELTVTSIIKLVKEQK